MSRLVIDSSIAIKWVVEEDGSAPALMLRRQVLVAPDLLIAECANALWKKVRRQEMSEEQALLAAGLIARAGIELISIPPYFETAARIAIALDHPAYDCFYLAIAEAHDLTLVTGDARLLRKIRQAASRRFRGRVFNLADAAML